MRMALNAASFMALTLPMSVLTVPLPPNFVDDLSFISFTQAVACASTKGISVLIANLFNHVSKI